MKLDDAASVADIINKSAVSLALIVGGGWAIYTFNGELKRENATAQLEKMNREIMTLKRETLQVTVAAKPLAPFSGALMVEAHIKLQNNGMQDLEVELPKESLRITPVSPATQNGQPTLNTKKQIRVTPIFTDISGHIGTISSLRVAASSAEELVYLAQVPDAGRYLVEFGAQAKNAQGEAKMDSEWSGSMVIDVPSKVSLTSKTAAGKSGVETQ